MKRAAIYARRSTEEHQAESIETQLDGARRFIAQRGWTEVAAFTDDGSRAEFRRRKGLLALLNAASERAFDLVVTRDESRLGGDMLRTGLAIQQLTDNGVEIWYYAHGQLVRVDDAVGRFVEMARNFASELEREKIASRTRENLEKKARRGLVAGGVVFGYTNVRSPDGVRRVVNLEESAIVREIFERAARGEGLRAIAHALNAAGVVPPRQGPAGWAPACIFSILRRPLYVGIVEWGRSHKAYRGGTKVRLETHTNELVRVEVPDLRVVPAELWEAVQTRMARHKAATGSDRKGTPARYLMSGFSRCGMCGGPIQAERVKRSHTSVPGYICSYRRERGPTVCKNTLRRPVDVVDAAILSWIRANVLSPAVVNAVLRELRARLKGARHPNATEVEQIEKRIRGLRTQLQRLTQAIALGSGPLPPLVNTMESAQKELDALEARRRAIGDPRKLVALSARRMEEQARARLANLETLLAESPTQGRKVLQALLVGPLRWMPTVTKDGARYEISGQLTIGRLALTEGTRGVLEASPAGFEPA